MSAEEVKKRQKAKKICPKCGKTFYGHGRAKYCEDCKEKMRSKKRKLIEPGKTYGEIEVFSEVENSGYKKYNCHCKKCGNDFSATGHQIFAYEINGCPRCRKIEAEKAREEGYKKYIGEKYGKLEIIGYAGKGKTSKNGQHNNPFMLCKCENCGGESKIPLYRLKAGGARMCRNCSKEKNLDKGDDVIKISAVGGTSIIAIDGRRKTNKNSSTGKTGVCFSSRAGKYRAYINFRRKQYDLGLYEKIEDAIAAREHAEKEIYGSFLEWYAQEYPEKWKRIKKQEK